MHRLGNDWLPVHDMLIEKVFETIAAAGQEAHGPIRRA
jgi:hypothetical protein